MVPWQGLLSLKLTCKQLESLHRPPPTSPSPFFPLSPSPLVPFNALINIHKASHKGRLVPLNGLLFNGDIYLQDYIRIQLQILSVILQLEQCMNKSIIWMQGEHLVLRGSASRGWGRGFERTWRRCQVFTCSQSFYSKSSSLSFCYGRAHCT